MLTHGDLPPRVQSRIPDQFMESELAKKNMQGLYRISSKLKQFMYTINILQSFIYYTRGITSRS
jgi:hypothetical protein